MSHAPTIVLPVIIIPEGAQHMVDMETARKAMVDQQIAPSGVTDPRLLSVFRRVPRELFVPPERRSLAYSDAHHPLGGRRFLPAPATFARLLQLAGISSTDRVLDYWPGSGYSTAILASLAREVVAIEPDAALAAEVSAGLADLGLANATVLNDDRPPRNVNGFDAILIEGAVETIPEFLPDLLVSGGRLVYLLRRGPVGTATVLTKGPEGVVARTAFNATLPSIDLGAPPEDFVF